MSILINVLMTNVHVENGGILYIIGRPRVESSSMTSCCLIRRETQCVDRAVSRLLWFAYRSSVRPLSDEMRNSDLSEELDTLRG